MSVDLTPVSVVIPTHDPDETKLSRTLVSFANQTRPPDEVLIVDTTRGSFPYDLNPDGLTGCGACPGQLFGQAAKDLTELGTRLRVLKPDGSMPRRYGVQNASNEYVARFDESAVLTKSNHMERAARRLDDEGMVGVTCRVNPIRNHVSGRVAANLLGGYFPIYVSHHDLLDQVDDERFITHLKAHGNVVQEDDLVVLADLPTESQVRSMRVAGAMIGSGLGAALLAELARR